MSKKIYVGNLSYKTTSEGLQSLFSHFGEVTNVTIVNDRETGRSKGFAFVEMLMVENADNAIQDLNGKEFEGRRLKVSEAVNKPRLN